LREDVLKEEGSSTEDSLSMLLYWYRDLLVSKFTQERDNLFNIDRSEEIFSYSKMFTERKLRKDIFNIMDTMDYMKRNINPKIAIFNMAIKLKEQT